MKHPNGNWQLRQTGSDSVPAHPYANQIPTNAERKNHKPASGVCIYDANGNEQEINC